MSRAPNQSTVRPSELYYKGRRVFIPANKLGDHPDIINALDPNVRQMAQLAEQRDIAFIPDDGVISMICRDMASEFTISDNDDLTFADPEIVFEEIDAETWESVRYKTDDPSPMDTGTVMFGGNQLGWKRMICHVSKPFWYPTTNQSINNVIRVKTTLWCNRVTGIQTFIPVVPYAAVFGIPKLWIPKEEKVLAELKRRLLALYRDEYEIELGRERRTDDSLDRPS